MVPEAPLRPLRTPRSSARSAPWALRSRLAIRPVEPSGARGPNYRVLAVGDAFGAVRKMTRKAQKAQVSLQFGGLGFADAINAALVQIDGVRTLAWSRLQVRND